jgi:hypothetical protein
MWSISIAVVERSLDIKAPKAVDEDPYHETAREPHCTEGTFEHERRAPQSS